MLDHNRTVPLRSGLWGVGMLGAGLLGALGLPGRGAAFLGDPVRAFKDPAGPGLLGIEGSSWPANPVIVLLVPGRRELEGIPRNRGNHRSPRVDGRRRRSEASDS